VILVEGREHGFWRVEEQAALTAVEGGGFTPLSGVGVKMRECVCGRW
jgi:hypothetical protein